MTAYRQYWLLTGLLLAATIYVVYAGVVGWAMVKFPELQGQLITVVIISVFLYTYAIDGHGAAKLLSYNERALRARETLCHLDRSDVEETLAKAKRLHNEGKGAGQQDFSALYDLLREQFEDRMTARMGQIDTVRVFLFFAGLLFTVIGIVQGFASQQFPTNPEEAKIYTFTIIKALGLSYLPATECLGGTLILFILSSALTTQASALTARFSDILYRAAFFGDITAEDSPETDPIPEKRRLLNAQPS